MEIKIKNNITRILIDINRSASDMDHAPNSDNYIYIDLLLSQIAYLTDNLNILKDLIGNDFETNNKISQNTKEIYHKDNEIKIANNFLPQNTKNNSDIIINMPDNTKLVNHKEEIPIATEALAVSKDIETKLSETNISLKQRQALKNVISLNDKFTFVRYLFKNNITIYSEHINNIDKLTNKEDILIYINKYLSKLYDWDDHPEKKELFINIIEKQFD